MKASKFNFDWRCSSCCTSFFILLTLAGLICPAKASAPIGNFTQGTANTSSDTPATVESIPLQVTATKASPPSISIESWVPGTFTIYRKDPSSSSWGTAVATGVALTPPASISSTGTVWTDTNVVVGTLYEYRFVNTAASPGPDSYGNSPNGYILTGIQVDQTAPKRMIALITALDLPVNLPAEYAQYKADLLDDGWQVREIQVPRAANYNGVGNGTGIATVKVVAGTGATTSAGSGSAVTLTNSSGKKAIGTLGVSGTSLNSIGIPAGGCGTGFAVGDPLTITGKPTVAGSGAYLTSTITGGQSSLSYAYPVTGGTGYTDGETVTLTGQTSHTTAQCTLSTDATTGAITDFNIVSSNTGFIMYEPLNLTGNSTGSGVGSLLAYSSSGALAYVYIYGSDSGYTSGETGTLTGVTSGATAQVTLNTYLGHINSATVTSGGTGFTAGENLTLSGTATGTNPPVFYGSYSTTGTLQSVTVNQGGTGYVNGAHVILQGSYGTAQGTLVTGTGGVITGVTITTTGSGFTSGGYITLVGVISNYTYSVLTLDSSDLGKAVMISGGGSGYSDNDTVTIRGNTSGVTAIGSLIAPAGAVTGVSVVLPNTFTAGETLTITPTLGGSGGAATAGPSTSYHLLIRSAVQALYNTYPGQLKNISIVGKVPVCRSGIDDGASSDGHGNECSYGTDAFYAEMLGVIGVDWTDTGDNSSYPPLGDYNLAGDGQYDQQRIYEINKNGTGGVQLGFGRIDLSLSIQTEVEAERNYFNKLHRYKIADPSFLPGRYVCDRLSYTNEREADLQAMPGVVGMQNIAFITGSALPTVNADQDSDQLYTTQNGPFLFYFKGSGGPGPGVNGKAVFWTGMQSHWGFWYQSNLVTSGSNDMQLRDAENSFTLDFTWNIFGLRYIYHRMGMGLDAGDMLKQSINNQNISSSGNTAGYGPYNYKNEGDWIGECSSVLYMNQMGDPALRLFMFAPPTALSVVATTGSPVLTWTASTEPTVTGYHVYRAPYMNAQFARLTSTPVTGTTYTDTSVSSGSYVYMVRAVRLEVTGGGTTTDGGLTYSGGTFYNASLGATQSVTVGAAPTPVVIQTTSVPALPWQTASTITLAATGGVPQYSWSLTGNLPAGMSLSPLGVISGTPTAVGSFPISVTAKDQVNQTATQALTITVNANTSTVLYPVQTTFTGSGGPTASYGTYEYNAVAGPVGTDETFHQYDLSGVNLYNGFQKATLYLYVTSGTAASGVFAPIQASLLTDAADGWVANGIAKAFSGFSSDSSNGGALEINCPNHGFSNGTQLTIAGITGTGAPTTGTITKIIDANNFDVNVTYNSGWAYDPALAVVSTGSLTYNTRPTSYDTNVPTLTATGTDTPGTWLQFDVTPYVQEVIKNNFASFPSKKMGIRFFTGTLQTVDLGSLNSFGNSLPYLVIQTTNAPNITVNSPTQNPVSLNIGSTIYFNTTVTPLPPRVATLQWSQMSGPTGGTTTFTNPNSASTGASFSVAGQYVVQLTANDGVSQSSQTFTVNVLSVPLAGPTDSMALRLPFDETSGSTAYDQSGYGNNGTFGTNGAAWTASGKVGGAVLLANSNQQVAVNDPSTNPAPLDGQANMTFSFWFNPTAVDTDGSTRAILNKTGAYNFEVRNTAIYITFTTSGILQELNNSGVTAGKWYHVAAVFNGSTKTQLSYVNGYLISSSSVSGSSVVRKAGVQLYVGAVSSTDTHAFNGMIDEVRIYNRALNLSEIQALAAIKPSNLGPVITTNPTLTGSPGIPLALTAGVVDNDPVGGALTYNWSQTSGPATLTIASPGSLSTTTTPSQPGSYGLQFLANDGVITSYANIGASITSQFSSWAAAHGLTGNNALPTTVLLPDGLNNLFKYALGLDPTKIYNPGAAGLPTVQTTVDGKYLTLSFNGVATDVTYNVQASSDLVNWTAIQTFLSGSGAPGNQTVQDTQQIGVTPKRFMRLYMTNP